MSSIFDVYWAELILGFTRIDVTLQGGCNEIGCDGLPQANAYDRSRVRQGGVGSAVGVIIKVAHQVQHSAGAKRKGEGENAKITGVLLHEEA
jgi:hypothetical protein